MSLNLELLAQRLDSGIRELERIRRRNEGAVRDPAYVGSGKADNWEDANDGLKELYRARAQLQGAES